MKTKFKATNVFHHGKSYAEGFIEIDDEKHEIVFRGTKKGLFSESEVLLGSSRYNEKEFPQFEGFDLEIGDFSVTVPSSTDRQQILETFVKPFRVRKDRTVSSLNRLETQAKALLLARASAIEYLILLRENPRKVLFTTAPEILANSDNPVETATVRQENIVDLSLDAFKDEVSAEKINSMLNSTVIDAICEMTLAIGALQDAIFQDIPEETEVAGKLLRAVGLSLPSFAGASVQLITNNLVNEYVNKMNSSFVDTLLGFVECSSCGKYYDVAKAKICPYCKAART